LKASCTLSVMPLPVIVPFGVNVPNVVSKRKR